MSEGAGTFYRIIRSEQAQEGDFECDALKHFQALQAGEQPRYFPKSGWALRQWSGLSVLDNIEAAKIAAREFNLGGYAAEITLPQSNGKNVLLELAGSHGHYIVWAAPRFLLSYVRSVIPL